MNPWAQLGLVAAGTCLGVVGSSPQGQLPLTGHDENRKRTSATNRHGRRSKRRRRFSVGCMRLKRGHGVSAAALQEAIGELRRLTHLVDVPNLRERLRASREASGGRMSSMATWVPD